MRVFSLNLLHDFLHAKLCNIYTFLHYFTLFATLERQIHSFVLVVFNSIAVR